MSDDSQPTDIPTPLEEDEDIDKTVSDQGNRGKEVDEGERSLDEQTQQDTPDTDEVDENPQINPEIIEKLTTGVLGLYLPNLQKARGTLNECLHNQEVLIETIQQENAKFSESTAMQQLINTMHEARVYQNKLVNLKKEMNTLTERSAKIKKRAVRLQQNKHKEQLERAVQRDRELEKEKKLTAKVAKDAK